MVGSVGKVNILSFCDEIRGNSAPAVFLAIRKHKFVFSGSRVGRGGSYFLAGSQVFVNDRCFDRFPGFGIDHFSTDHHHRV
ncbi:hypothetical protein D3C87_1812270 [compost metagenome]